MTFLASGHLDRLHIDSTCKFVVNDMSAKTHAWMLLLIASGFPLPHVRRGDRGACAPWQAKEHAAEQAGNSQGSSPTNFQ